MERDGRVWFVKNRANGKGLKRGQVCYVTHWYGKGRFGMTEVIAMSRCLDCKGPNGVRKGIDGYVVAVRSWASVGVGIWRLVGAIGTL